MKKRLITIVSIVLVLCYSFSSIDISANESELKEYMEQCPEINSVFQNEDYQIIEEAYASLNSRDYCSYIEKTGGKYHEQLVELARNEVIADKHIGMYNIKNICVFAIWEMNEYQDYIEIIEQMCHDATDIKVYLVKAVVESFEDSDFYSNGVHYELNIIGSVNDERKILSVNNVFSNTIEDFENDNSQAYALNTRATSTDISNGVCIPSTIKVLRNTGNIDTVDFKTYCRRVAASEVGYDSYDTDYHKAGCIALKNYAMYKILTSSSPLGYHICDNAGNGQVYNPSVNYNSWPNLMNALDSVWNLFLVE